MMPFILEASINVPLLLLHFCSLFHECETDVLLKVYSGIQPVRQYTNENIVLNVKLLQNKI